VEDELAIRRLLASYCQLCDDGDFEGVAALFAPGATFSFLDDAATGHDAIARWLEAAQPPSRRGKHLTANVIIELGVDGDGDRARAVSDYVVVRFIRGALTPWLAGRYHDELQRIDGRWRFTRRAVDLMKEPPG
jgi:uncharacterized protein (TIGR02246 family)